MTKIITALYTVSFILTFQSEAIAEVKPNPIDKVAINQNLNSQLPLETPFINEHGEKVLLGDYFNGKPVILSFVYYECPMLCTLTLNGLVRTLNVMNFSAGDEFEIVTISFDPGETPEMSTAKKRAYMNSYHRQGSKDGWHFLTGTEESIKTITEAVGFEYAYDEESDEYAHGAAIMIATPQGKLARYMYGIEYGARDLKLALIEASKNKIGSFVDQVLLYCFHYDPSTGKYSVAIMRLMRLAGLLTIGSIIAFFGMGLLKGKKK